MPTRAEKEKKMATRLVSNFVLLSLWSENHFKAKEQRKYKIGSLVASPESYSIADTTYLASFPFPEASLLY